MPLRATHVKVNSYIFLPVFMATLYFFVTQQIGMLMTAAVSFLYATLYLSPDDLDLAKNVKLFSVRGILTLPFRGISNVLKHRGVSHNLLIAPFLKIFILLLTVGAGIFFCQVMGHMLSQNGISSHALRAIAIGTAMGINDKTPGIISYLNAYQEHICYGLGAVLVADAGHILLDKIKKN